MCIGQLEVTREQDELAKLPDTFPCWKIVQTNDYCQYDFGLDEPKFTRKTHTAVFEKKSYHRMTLCYPPGFHAYLKKPSHVGRSARVKLKIVKCWANKRDVVYIGYDVVKRNMLAVAVSKITRK